MKTVITYGTFDLFHEGHINLLRRAKRLGDKLIVGVTTEQFDIQRGKMNIADSLMRRVDNVRNSGYADEVIIEEHVGQKVEDIQKYNIDIFAVGSDWRGKFDYLKEYCQVVYLERTKDISSSELRDLRNSIVRLGIAGTGRIAERTMEELKFVSGVFAIAAFNPHEESVRRFTKKFELEYAFVDYLKFLNTVDAVYIASPHGTHYDYTKQALSLGKHVLCEKPFVLKKDQAEELFEIAEKNGLVLMEAIKTAYAPGFRNMLAIAKSGKIGSIRDVEATFTKLVEAGENVREYDKNVGGAFTELASYPLLPIMKLLGTKYQDVRFESFADENGIDVYTKAHFKYQNAIATAKTGIGVKSEGQLLVSGTSGYILIKSPWWLLKGFEVCYEDVNQNEYLTASFPGYGMRLEVMDFIRNINEIELRNFKLLPSESVAIAGVIEKFLEEKKKTYHAR